jgi:DNA polymerase III delta subunit
VSLLDARALQKLIDSRRLGPLHVLIGEDVREVGRLADAVEASIDPADRPFATERIYALEPGGAPIDIAAAARVFPMLGDRRIVIVLRAERLLKPKRASKAAESGEVDESVAERVADEATAELGPLEDYVDAPVPSTTLVFVTTEIDKTRRFTKRLLEKAHVTECGGFRGAGPAGGREARAAATDFLRAELARAGRAIDPTALHLLAARAGDDITKLRGDVERLLLYTEGRRTISPEDVEEVASMQVAVDDWAVVNAIADGDGARALRAAADRLERGDSPHALVGQLRWWVSTRLAEGQPERVQPAVEALLRTDLALKSSSGEPRVLVERLVTELTGKPVPRRGWK